MNSRTYQQALTLVELLVVLAVIVAVVALLLPSIGGLRARAQAVSCTAAMRQFGVAVLTYRNEHNGYLPPGKLIPFATPDNQNVHSGINLKRMLLDGGYLKDIPYCPLMRLTPQGIANLKTGETEQSRLKTNGSYAINLYLAQVKIEALPGPHWRSYPYPGDSRMTFIAETYNCGFTWAFDHQKFTLNGADWGGLFVAPRDHGSKRLHFMFLDGHIKSLAPKVKGDGSYDWSDVFDSWGRNGKYINSLEGF